MGECGYIIINVDKVLYDYQLYNTLAYCVDMDTLVVKKIYSITTGDLNFRPTIGNITIDISAVPILVIPKRTGYLSIRCNILTQEEFVDKYFCELIVIDE